MTDYERIAKAIGYISKHFREQPDLTRVSREVFLSPFHFQRMFQRWAGVTPKKFLEYVSIEHAKKILREDATVAEATAETGLSGTGRLHDLFVTIEGMTPGEYKREGENLAIGYAYHRTPFGAMLIATTPRGICHAAFADNEAEAIRTLRTLFPKAALTKQANDLQHRLISAIDRRPRGSLTLHLRGTPFQLKVWEALLRIPSGRLTTYAALARLIGEPGAARAVGRAVATNPVAFLIPCHRVIRSTGVLGGYHWGEIRKKALVGWEAARADREAV